MPFGIKKDIHVDAWKACGPSFSRILSNEFSFPMLSRHVSLIFLLHGTTYFALVDNPLHSNQSTKPFPVTISFVPAWKSGNKLDTKKAYC